MLVDHPLIMIGSAKNLYLPTLPKTHHSSISDVEASVSSHIRRIIESQNVSTASQYIPLSPWRKLTRVRYTIVLEQWHDFCERKQAIHLLTNTNSALNFFIERYEKGCQYSSITLPRSALASAMTLKGYSTLSESPVTKPFIKRVCHLGPSKQKYYFIWNADILLMYLEHIEDNSQVNLLHLFKKITTLLVLFHGLRISIIATFDFGLITRSYDMCVLYPSKLLKQDQQGRLREKSFKSLKILNEYLKRRA